MIGGVGSSGGDMPLWLQSTGESEEAEGMEGEGEFDGEAGFDEAGDVSEDVTGGE